MRVSVNWLKDWLALEWDTATLSHQLSMAGLEVDGIEPAAEPFERVVVAQVIEVMPHPDADKLKLCQVSIGSSEAQVQVVCGAVNVAPGLKVPLAQPGASLASGVSIKSGKIRGVTSEGMLCSAEELGLAEGADGLLVLPDDVPLGESLWSLFELDDKIIEVDLTPNRADCLSMMGIAREVAALAQLSWSLPFATKVDFTEPSTRQAQLSPNVHLEALACPSYLGRVIRNVDNKRKVPIWLSERLRRAGIRSLSPVVDVTNYVMLELGQPMHAFDLEKLNGDIHVRYATPQETLVLLDGKEVTLNPDQLVIADEKRSLALAGIMGGAHAAVSSDSTEVFLESAYFEPEQIAGKAREFGLHTQSSHRFERGVSPDIQTLALDRATTLVIAMLGGEVGPLVTGEPSKLAQDTKGVLLNSMARPSISLNLTHINQLLGPTVSEVLLCPKEVERILNSLGFRIQRLKDQEAEQVVWQVQPPAFRFDMALEVDLIEELARVVGYENLPSYDVFSAPLPRLNAAVTTEMPRASLAQIKQTLVAYGYAELITYSFVDETALLKLVQTPPLLLKNPLSNDQKAMRTTLALGLLNALVHNRARQKNRCQFFEQGLRFDSRGQELDQIPTLSGLISGSKTDSFWLAGSKQYELKDYDFYDLKGHISGLLALCFGASAANAVVFEPTQNIKMLHPGQASMIKLDDQPLGFMGALHPSLCKDFDLESEVFVFELDLKLLQSRRLDTSFKSLSRYPIVSRDLAVVVEESQDVGPLLEAVECESGPNLHQVRIFDVYQGQGVELGKKSVAFTLTFRHPSRTLKEEEVNQWVDELVSSLGVQFNAKLRL